MSSRKYYSLVAVAVVAALVAGIAHHMLMARAADRAFGSAKAVQSQAMPGMDMPGMQMSEKAKTDTASVQTPAGYAPVTISRDVQQRVGVTLGRVEQTPLTMAIRTVGIVQPDETRLAHIHIKTEGWVERLFVAYTGQKVRAGDPLLSIYSPTFYAAQREFLSALSAARMGLSEGPDQQTVIETARRRLQLWDVPRDEIEALERTREPHKYLTLRSPISGTILEKQAFSGQRVTADSELYVVADLSVVWMQARIFQSELSHIAVGMPATVSISSMESQPITGKIVFIDPVIDEMSRSLQVRIELSNSSGQLRPGMFGDVSIAHQMGAGLTVPSSAIIRTGERDIAFLAVSADRFVPTEVRINPVGFADRLQVLEGLKAGDQVVTSANFLVDSESRLESGASSMAGMPGMGASE